MIKTENLIIRKHFESDWEALYAYLSLAEIYTFEPGEPISIEESKSLINYRCKSNDFYAVVLKNNNYMIGHLYFNLEEPNSFMTWQLGYIFNPKYKNKGFCTEASSAIIKYAFEEWKAHKVVAYCNPENVPSWKVLEKIGMEQEGFF